MEMVSRINLQTYILDWKKGHLEADHLFSIVHPLREVEGWDTGKELPAVGLANSSSDMVPSSISYIE